MMTGSFLTRTGALVLGALLFVLSGCGGDDTAPTPNSDGGQAAAQTLERSGHALKLSGTPRPTATVGQLYSFQPTSTDPAGRILSFSIQNKPDWTSFDTSTGQLSGTPTGTDSGTNSNIVITVNDGAATAAITPFAINVTPPSANSVTLTWAAPTENTNGSLLVNLVGYRIYYGTDPSDLTTSIDVKNVAILTYNVENLTHGTWYFAVTAVNSDDAESNFSSINSATI